MLRIAGMALRLMLLADSMATAADFCCFSGTTTICVGKRYITVKSNDIIETILNTSLSLLTAYLIANIRHTANEGHFLRMHMQFDATRKDNGSNEFRWVWLLQMVLDIVSCYRAFTEQ